MDVEKAKSYYNQIRSEDLCDCDYCRNNIHEVKAGVCESFSVNRIFRSSMIKYKIIGGLILWQEKRNRYTKYK